MESVVWTIDWNPEFEEETRLKREILKALRNDRVIDTVKRFGEQAVREGKEGHETEHILWLDSSYSYAFFVRVWFDAGDGKLFIIVEENDLGDVGFLLIDSLDCASYGEARVLKVEFKEPDDIGIPP